MSTQAAWVATVEATDLAPLAALRLLPGLEFALLPPVVWLRGSDWNEALALALRKTPGLRRYTLLPDNRLLADGQRVPGARLPSLTWQAFRDGLRVTLPAGASPAVNSTRAPVRLVRASIEQPANALLTPWMAWNDFAVTAAEIRLKQLRFAAADDGRAWIEGLPVPSLAGDRYHLQDGVGVPCGWTVAPALDVAVLRRWLGLAADDTALAIPDHGWEILRAEQFVPASRQAARLTNLELARHE